MCMPRFIGEPSQAPTSRSAERVAIFLTMLVIVVVWVVLVRVRVAQTVSAAVEQFKNIATETAGVRTEVRTLREPVLELKRAPQEALLSDTTPEPEEPAASDGL